MLYKLNAHYLNNTRKADVDIIFFNRCPKVGSEALFELFMKLEEFNNLNIDQTGLKAIPVRKMPKKEQREHAKEIISLDEGSVYIEHVNWIDFEAFDLPKPIYINLVRDPVERVISWFYYVRSAYKNAILFRKQPDKPMEPAKWFKKDFNSCVRSGDPECQYIPYTIRDQVPNSKRQSLFFCGHNDNCHPFNSPTAIQMAKEHVERDYAVVGSWEDTNITLTVFEKYIPRFFQGAKVIFELHMEKITNRNKNKRKPKIDEDVREMIRKNFTHEYDFYYFCKQRLYKQYLAVNLQNLNALDLYRLNSHYLNNTRKADVDIIFFNRCPKVGSEALLELFLKLEQFNDLSVDKEGLKKPARRKLSKKVQRKLADEILELGEGSVYIDHINWIDFETFDLPKPIFINLVRDPVERVISWYYYARGSFKNAVEYRKDPDKPMKSSEWFKKDFNSCVRSGDPECQYVPYTINQKFVSFKRQSIFFCGHHDDCYPFNSPTAVQMAKEHVERDYAVVGSWEDTNITLTVFEKYIPRFFQGAKVIFELHNDKITNRNKNKRKPKIDDDVRDMIRKNFTHEYDFYYFCKQRLYKQYLAVNLQDLNALDRHPRSAEVNKPEVKDEPKEGDHHHHHHQRRSRAEKKIEHQRKGHDNANNNKKHVRGHNHDDEDESEDEDEDEDDYVDTSSNNLQADLLNNTKKAEIDMLFFNRVPKVGSQSLMQLMASLGKINGFVHARDPGKAHETIILKPPQQKELLKDLISRPKPNAYSQHIAYINFTRFHMPKPIYINMIRHPIERIISWHYYVRAEWYYKDMKLKLGDKAPPMPPREFLDLDLDTCVREKDIHCVFKQGEIKNPAGDHRRQTLFFCGQNQKLCMPFNSKAAMQKAKRTVEEDYAVVGTWEDTNITLTVFEHYIPLFFRNAKVAYYLSEDRLSKVNKNPVRKPVSDLSREILAKNLTNEIEFYEFCKQRLYLQYAAINGGNKIDNDDYLLVPEHDDGEDDEY